MCVSNEVFPSSLPPPSLKGWVQLLKKSILNAHFFAGKQIAFIFSMGPAPVVISRSQVQSQAPAETRYSCLPVPPCGQAVTWAWEDQWTYNSAHQRPCSSLRTTSHQPQWQAVFVGIHSEETENSTAMWGLHPHSRVIHSKCDSGCGDKIPHPLSHGEVVVWGEAVDAAGTCYMFQLKMGGTCNTFQRGPHQVIVKSDITQWLASGEIHRGETNPPT